MSTALYDPCAVDHFVESRLSAIHETIADVTNRVAMLVTPHSLLADAQQAERIERRYRIEADHMAAVAAELRKRANG